MQSLLNTIPHRKFAYAAVAVVVLVVVAVDCRAANLQQQTIAAFNHYVRLAEQPMKATLRPDGPFLWMDSQSASRRKAYYQQLRSGHYVIQRVEVYDDGQTIEIPGGMIHHWVGIGFVPGATLESAAAVLEDYQDYARIYAPEVRRSKILARSDDGYILYLQLYKDAPRQVSFNTIFDVRRMKLCPTRIVSSSVSTRIAQLQDPADPDSAVMPVGQDSGYLWRMNNYWRFEQKDGGVYMQVEAISLSRDVPTLLSWFIKPIIRRVARQTIASLLDANCRAIKDPTKYAPAAIFRSSGNPAALPSSPAR